MSDKMRDDFEVWLRPYAQAKGYGYMDVLVRIDPNTGDYSTAWVDSAWIGWQASRAALVVELPERDISAYGGPDSEMGPSAEQYEGVGYNWALDACRDAIHAAGVKTSN